ncbi:thymidylate kinase [Nematocida ausubeli]|uniref:dTMP kinase n=1 Tax=Nematocida ausubeli (strain ATCC PRA-371 / ERTm2) TaxID=1913371 RepID=H8ZA88_NEMA1|nr:thymidylate kinase [Nematocida ausubeli]
MQKSLFVVIEGIDRSGKSSLAAALKTSLASHGVVADVISYPNRKNMTGMLISQVLAGDKEFIKEATHLLFSANRWEDKERIENLMQPCEYTRVILCDRYILSGISYSIANGIPKEFAMASDKGMTLPDLTIFLDVSPETASARAGFGLEIYEKKEFQQKVYTEMKCLLDKYRHTVIPSETQEEMHRIALKRILDLIAE